MKRNWYACAILAALVCLLALGERHLNQTCSAVQQCALQAYDAAQQKDYATAQLRYRDAVETLHRSRAGLTLLVRRNLLDALEQTLATLCHYANADNTADLAVEHARALTQLQQLERSFLGCF